MTSPLYRPAGDECELFERALSNRLPVMLTGPTGCGKTRLVEHMAAAIDVPLITVTCHDDLSTADLVGRYLIQEGDVRWIDGPLTRAVRTGAMCYLDEVIEARRDSLAVLHPLADHRRTLYLERTGESVEATDGFALVCSYNPRGRGSFKELRPSFRQRFVTIACDYLDAQSESVVVASEAGVDSSAARRLVDLANLMRAAAAGNAAEAPSTRQLVNAALLVASGAAEDRAFETALLAPLSAAPPMEEAVRELLQASL